MDFVAIDFETANEKRDSACAIGITTVCNGRIVDSYSHLIRPPELRFSPWNSRIHGLTESDVEDAPTFAELWPAISSIIENKFLVAHNASFDISVLRHSLHAVSIPVPRLMYICSVHLARSVWPGFPSHSLGYLAELLGISLSHHDACSDSRATAEIVLLSMKKTGMTSIISLANDLDIRLGEVISADEWIPATAPSLRHQRERVEIVIPEGFDITAHEFYERDVVFTGELRMFRRSEAFRIVEQFGGYPSASVTKKTSYLVTGSQDVRMLANGSTESSKLKRAMKLQAEGLDLRIITESDFLEIIFSPNKLEITQ